MIRTRYIGPTNTKGARIRATNGARSVTIPYPYELSTEDAHMKAADKLILILHEHDEERVEYAVARSTRDDGYCLQRIERDGE
jgi:hypothetical protein